MVYYDQWPIIATDAFEYIIVIAFTIYCQDPIAILLC